jgi:radical SAM protein
MSMSSYRADDFEHSPMLVFYEMTRACNLLCRHCRAEAQPNRHPLELSTASATSLIRQLATFPLKPVIVFTGGDPLKREDVHDLVREAVDAGLEAAMTPSATPLVTREAIEKLKNAGLHRLAVSLDGADAAMHDAFRQVEGSYARTLEIIADARAAGLPVQINTTVTRSNRHQLSAIADLLAGQGIVLWSVFFLVPVGRGMSQERLSAEEVEEVFGEMYRHSQRQPYAIKTTEAPHYRRFMLQQRKAAADRPVSAPAGSRFAGTNDGKGVMFISHIGQICPSGFLPIRCGVFPRDSVVDVYQNHPTFRELRDADRLGGKCGRCEYRNICGGSRARAYATSGGMMDAEPDCAYVPIKARDAQAVSLC